MVKLFSLAIPPQKSIKLGFDVLLHETEESDKQKSVALVL